jgi:hypothetical protein
LTRTFFVCGGVIVLSFALLFGGAWLAAQIIIRNPYFGTNNKDQLISFFLIQSFIILPGVAVVVGIVLGYFLHRGTLWLAGISLLPLLIYDLSKGEWRGADIVLNLIYLMLGVLSAFAISKLRRGALNRKTHV